MIIQRYLFREILQTFVAVLSVLLMIYISNRFVRYLAEAAAGQISSEAVLQLLALKLISKLVLLLPLALYIAILLAFGRLYKDSEVIAMTAGGVSLARLAQTVFWLSTAFAVVALILGLYVSPKVSSLLQARQEQAKEESEIAGIFPGRFKEFSDGDQILYVEDIASNRRRMENVFVQVRGSRQLELLVSESAYQTTDQQTGDRFIVLVDGHRYEGSPGAADYVITKFEQHAVRIEESTESPNNKDVASLPTRDLLAGDKPAYIAELQWRLSHPIAAVLLGMLAVPLAKTSPREGRYAKLFTAVLIFFVYNNLLSVAHKLVERGDLVPAVGVWPVHAVLALIVLGLLHSQSSRRRRFSPPFSLDGNSDRPEQPKIDP